MTTTTPAAATAPQIIATIMPRIEATRQPAEQAAASPAGGHYGPQGHNPESNGNAPGPSSDSVINDHPPGVKRICPQCGTAFEPNSGKHVFCVRNCQQQHAYHRFRILHEKTCAAPGCRRTFTVTDPRRPKVARPKDHRYCCDDCQLAGWWASPAGQASYHRTLAKGRADRAHPRRQERCDHCNEILTGLWSQRWCNRECEKAFNRLPREHPRCLARECGAEIIGGRSHRKYCNDLCAWREAGRRKAERRIATRRLAAVA